MDIGETRELTIEEFFNLSQEEGGEFQIETPDGWQDIGFLVQKDNKECYNLILDNGVNLECSSSHQVLTENGWVKSKNIDVNNDKVLTKSGFKGVKALESIGIHNTYDLNVISDEHSYYSNDIVSHNCGKSLCAKAAASLYEMPLLKLDFGRLFGSLVGESESTTRDAIKLAETIAPCILWADEIEKGLSGAQSSGQTDGGTTSRVVSTFLTWMQEKESPVFIFCTANNHNAIPPEFMRAGRFDEVFFVDLPNMTERREIYNVLLRRYNRKPSNFNLDKLAMETENYSGAEIEKTIVTALFEGFYEEQREIKTDDIIAASKTFKPLYDMRKDVFENMREWAEDQCRLASDPESAKGDKIGIDLDV